ncbi:MAG TPA: septum site-determining protein Ssd [Micrococcaceae bacterium]|nr:septum site-determining protein Ssd [Micrococcaceae bacterium]
MAEPITASGQHAGRPNTAVGAGSGRARHWVPAKSAVVLLLSGSALLQDEVARIAAAAALTLSVVVSAAQAIGEWDGAAAVLVGSDYTGALPHRRGPIILVGLSMDRELLWQQASASGADRVAALPEASVWLAEYLGRLRDSGASGFVVGVVGGCGGAGASTLAIMLAAAAADRGIRVLLADGDEWGGGLDLAVAAEEVAGLRWPDLQRSTGTISPVQLAASLPVVAGFSLLSWGQHPAPAPGRILTGGVGVEVLKAARRGYELTVVDVGRSPEALSSLGQGCDLLVAVSPARIRCAVAAAQLIAGLPETPTSLVVRAPIRDGLDAGLIADSVGVPLAGVMPVLRSAAALTERGQLLTLARNRGVRRLTAAILENMQEPAA